MRKLAIAVMLLSATSAFGAVVTLGTETGATSVEVPEGTTSFTLYLTSDTPLAGLGLGLKADEPGLVATGVTYTSGWLSNAEPIPLGPLDGDGTADIGGNGIVDSPAGTILMTVTLGLTGAPGTWTISSNESTYWWNADFSIFEILDAATNDFVLKVTPEPASMLLLAAGSLLFARRRRA